MSIKIMPLGDSVTAGYNLFVGGYRKPLLDELAAVGIDAVFVGGQTANNPTGRTDLNHEGHNGFTTTDLMGWVRTGIITTYNPDVVLLLIGVNDSFPANGIPFATSQANYSNILSNIFSTPGRRVVGMGIPVASPYKAQVAPYNTAFANIMLGVTGHAANWIPAAPVPDSCFANDGIHPTVQGYNVMSLAWASWLAQVLQA